MKTFGAFGHISFPKGFKYICKKNERIIIREWTLIDFLTF